MSENFDVFISYQWDIKDQVKLLHKKLSLLNIKAWRDDSNLRATNLPLSEQLAIAIKKSKIFLCFFTQKYSESKNCNLELNYAHDLGKPIIVLAIEKPDLEKLVGMGLIISNTIRINCYKHTKSWSEDDFESIKKSIDQNLEVLLFSFRLNPFKNNLKFATSK